VLAAGWWRRRLATATGDRARRQPAVAIGRGGAPIAAVSGAGTWVRCSSSRPSRSAAGSDIPAASLRARVRERWAAARAVTAGVLCGGADVLARGVTNTCCL